MIPNHILENLAPQDRVAILARDGELHFLVHGASADPAQIQSDVNRDGFEILTTHLKNKGVILEFVAARERDVGGEG